MLHPGSLSGTCSLDGQVPHPPGVPASCLRVAKVGTLLPVETLPWLRHLTITRKVAVSTQGKEKTQMANRRSQNRDTAKSPSTRHPHAGPPCRACVCVFTTKHFRNTQMSRTQPNASSHVGVGDNTERPCPRDPLARANILSASVSQLGTHTVTLEIRNG